MNPPSLANVIGLLRRVIQHADGNVCGQAYGLTVFTPIMRGEEAGLQHHLEELPTGADSPLARLRHLHCARLHILSELVYQGPPQKPEPLQSAYLIFAASFDGDLDRFLQDICAELPAEADAIWSRCVGYPGTRDPADFCRYVKHNQIHNHYFLTPYPHSTVQEVQKAMALRTCLAEFAIAAQEMDAQDLQQNFLETFGRP